MFCLISALVLGSSFLVIYCMYRKLNINLTGTLLENMFTFTIIGAIEFWFFMNIASKYIPITQSEVINSLFERLKYITQ
jgi:hypothetical protein